MGDPAQCARHAEKMIGSIRSLDELIGYEVQAKSRGIAAHEIALIEAAKRRIERASMKPKIRKVR